MARFIPTGKVSALCCAHCRQLLRKPVQTDEGFRLCVDCYEEIKRLPGMKCTDCTVSISDESQVYPDRAAQREVNSVEVYCPNKPSGCAWTGPLSVAEKHLPECPHNNGMECPNTGCPFTTSQAPLLDQHLEQCPYRERPCQYCRSPVVFSELAGYCEPCEESCPVCEKCKKHPPIGEETKSHDSKNIEHLEMATEKQKAQRDIQQTSELVIGDEKIAAGRENLAVLKKDHEQKVKVLTERIEKLEKEESEMKSSLTKSDEKINSLQQSVSALRSVVVAQQLANLQKIQMPSSALDEIRLRQEVLDVKTTNGILVWKIPDLRRRYRDAVDRRTISLYSPPFYTSPHGYRMCIHTYLNGDGTGKGTHISVFFVLMRSEFDNLLPWPFKQLVRLTLINQKKSAASITETFRPDPDSSSYKKPRNEMNAASGFPKFANQSILQDSSFTQDDAIFIKCQVDLTGLIAN